MFIRQKNKITLTENGNLAVSYACRVLDLNQEMIQVVRDFDYKNHVITIGSCAPTPLETILPILNKTYQHLQIESLLVKDEALLCDFENCNYQLAIFHEAPTNPDWFYCPIGTEQLYVAAPLNHPLAKETTISFYQLRNETMLLYSDIGFWQTICDEKMKTTKFLRQHNRETFLDLVDASMLLSFTSDIVMNSTLSNPNRVFIPITNSEASVTYY